MVIDNSRIIGYDRTSLIIFRMKPYRRRKQIRRRSDTLRCSTLDRTVGGRTSGETLIGAEGARLNCSISQAKGQKVKAKKDN